MNKKYPGVYHDPKNNTYCYKFSVWTTDHIKVHKTKRGFLSAKIAYEAKIADKKSVETINSYSVRENTTQFIGLVESFLSNLKENGLKGSTLLNYESTFRNYINPHFEALTIDNLTPHIVNNFRGSIFNKDLAIVSKNAILNKFRAFLRYLNLFLYINNDTFNSLIRVLTYIRGDSGNVKGFKGIYSLESFKTFASYFKDLKYKVICYILFSTGCRISECLALTVNDLDVKNKTLTFSKIAISKAPFIQYSLKTDTYKLRCVSINDSTFDLLRKYIQEENLKGPNLLFTGDDKTRPLYNHTVHKVFLRNAEKSNLPHIRLHDFRHSHICYLLDKGVDVKTVADRIGHKDVTTTMNVYNHVTDAKSNKLNTILKTLD